MMVAIYDVGLNSGHSSGRSSAPFKYSVNRSLLLKLPGKVYDLGLMDCQYDFIIIVVQSKYIR